MQSLKSSNIYQLSQLLLRNDVKPFFAQHCEDIFDCWVSLLCKTTLPLNISSMDNRIIIAFQALDEIIAGKDLHPLVSRLAYVQLSCFLSYLKRLVATDRRQGRISSKVGRRNSSVVMDLYLKAQKHIAHTTAVRKQLGRCVRIATRWAALAGTSPLLLVSYSNEAERIMFVLQLDKYLLNQPANMQIVQTLQLLIRCWKIFQLICYNYIQRNWYKLLCF